MTALLNAYEFESSANSEYSKTKFFLAFLTAFVWE